MTRNVIKLSAPAHNAFA